MARAVTDERPDPAAILSRLDEIQRALVDAQEHQHREERLGVLGTLAAMIAHEVRNIAAKVAGNAQLIERHADDPDRVRELAARVARLGLHAGRVAEAILDAADTPLPGDCSVLEVHRRAIEALPADARVRFVDTAIDASLRASIDPDALERVLVNLYQNALRAVGEAPEHAGGPHPGRIRVRARRRGVPVFGHTSEEHSDHALEHGCSTWNTLEIVVADDGPGVHPEMAERLFEPWQRGTVGAGHGLGLALCRHLVGSVGGTIRFEQRPRCGARVVVELPEPDAVRQAA
jgi:signal transduction histidine kinase